jgi:hypothetical protein
LDVVRFNARFLCNASWAFATLKVYSAELGKNQLYVGESMGSNVNPGLINHGLLIRGVFPQ